MPSAVLVVNTSSGHHLDHPEALADLLTCLADHGVEPQVLEGPINAQIGQSVRSSAETVIIDGGDGTISNTIAAHLGTGRTMAIIPGGTMNLLASDYGIPDDREAAAALIATGKVRTFDAGDINGRFFLHTALTGLPVRIGAHREKRRGRFGILDKAIVAIHALATIGRDTKLKLSVTEPRGLESVESATFAFVVGSLASGPMIPRPGRRTDTPGMITALSAHLESGADVARLVVRGAVGDVSEDPDVALAVFREAKLKGFERGNFHAMLDGERVLVRLPAKISVRRDVVRVLGPTSEPPKATAADEAPAS